MNVPEVRLEVAKYLPPPALSACTLVCKDWHSSFIPILYRNLAFFHSHPVGFPRNGKISQLAASFYSFGIHICSLSLNLIDVHMDQLLTETVNCVQLKDKASLEPTTTTIVPTTTTRRRQPQTPLFPNMVSLTLVIYDPEGVDLAWLAHCPRLQSLRLSITTQSWFRKMASRKALIPLSEILALPLWSTTLTHLRISSDELDDDGLELQILTSCPVLTELALSLRPLGLVTFQAVARFCHSLSHLNLMGCSNMKPWMLQAILGSFTELEKLSLSTFSVHDVMGVLYWSEETPSDLSWACTRLRCLHINFLEWWSEAEANTNLLRQLARLKELDSLYIMHMRKIGGEDRSTVVLHHFPMVTPWNETARDRPLAWMTKMWPRLTKYESGGW